MSTRDWDRFAKDGADWLPEDKSRIVILEQDDVLLMPPGLRVVHAVFTAEPSLMEGGMMWDDHNVPDILDGLLWVIQNQVCTNEAVAFQLPDIVDALEQWIQENHSDHTRSHGNANVDAPTAGAQPGVQITLECL
ncbi:hypothetical protein LTR85_001799 [Meristemomyces frigidus]|nr:hypothetical protein LTR85_001799 [Meristemomyces frigidus]